MVSVSLALTNAWIVLPRPLHRRDSSSGSRESGSPGLASFAGLPRRHPYGTIKPDGLAIEHGILDDMTSESCILCRPSQTRRKRNTRLQRLARRVR